MFSRFAPTRGGLGWIAALSIVATLAGCVTGAALRDARRAGHGEDIERLLAGWRDGDARAVVQQDVEEERGERELRTQRSDVESPAEPAHGGLKGVWPPVGSEGDDQG